MKKEYSLTNASVWTPLMVLACHLVLPLNGWAQSGYSGTAEMVPLHSVRLLEGPFKDAVEVNRAYLLAHEPDRLLAPFLREAGLTPKAASYGNWENIGLDGHTAGHYLAGLANMIASGSDTADGEFARRLDYMLDELEACQLANGNGYIGGVPNSSTLWSRVASGDVGAVWEWWVPWYNIHKTYAGLRDAYLVAGRTKARDLLVGLGDWCLAEISGLSDSQMQSMLGNEHGGMNEVMADLYAITGDSRYLAAAERFNHDALLTPLLGHVDPLTGWHANTQVPKVIGFERYSALAGDTNIHAAARFFWEQVSGPRAIAFGGNSVSEHFNDPSDFSGMLEHREGPETCNTYNMLRLSEQLFSAEPDARYVDYYERALYNHILSAINTDTNQPGYVYFTPIRPGHYRVYSQAEEGFWCCVGTGMENPGKYGQFIYAKADDGVFLNLFIASELDVPDYGLTLRQDTVFPDEEQTRLTLSLGAPQEFTLYLRYPFWVAEGALEVFVNGTQVPVSGPPSSYVPIHRVWQDGDVVEVALPMRTRVEPLPDGSPWHAIMHGPILMANPSSTENLDGLHADDSRMGHVASGPLVSLAEMPALLTDSADLPGHVVPEAEPMHFRLQDIVYPGTTNGLSLIPFFRLHDARYQMYWEFVDQQDLAERQETLAAAEQTKLAVDAATLDMVAIGEQQSETEHDFYGEGSGTGIYNGLRWRDGALIQYTLDTRGASDVDLVITYWGGDSGRAFDIVVNNVLLQNESLDSQYPGRFFERRYSVPAAVLAAASDGLLTVRFEATQWTAGGIFGLRLMSPDAAMPPKVHLKFNEESGTTAYDTSGNDWDATLINGPLWVPGSTGNAVELDGADDYVELPGGVLAGLTHCTISTWVNLNNVSDWARIFDFGTATDNYMFITPSSSAGTVRFAMRTPSVGEQIIEGAAPIPANEWTHVAVTLAGSTGILYIDGLPVGTNSTMTLLPSSLGFTGNNWIGRSQYSWDAYLDGIVDDFRIYNPALDAAAITAMASIPPAPESLSATAGDRRVAVEWSPVEGVSEYRLGRSTVSGGPYATIVSGISASTGFTDFGLTNGIIYYYTLTAANGAGTGGISEEVSAIPSAGILSGEFLFADTLLDGGTNLSLMLSNTVPGHVYQIWTTDNLLLPDWQPVGPGLAGNSSNLAFDIPITAVTTSQYFKLDVQRQ